MSYKTHNMGKKKLGLQYGLEDGSLRFVLEYLEIEEEKDF